MIKYIFNENIFETIDTPEKAYWIGFLYADGYITADGMIGCSLQSRDKLHLNKFLTFLEMPEEQQEECIKYYENTQSYRITLGRKTTYKNLIDLGFSINKSHENNLNVWKNIPELYKKFFILGLWDGDGSFSITPKEKIQTASLICNNDFLINVIANYINKNIEPDFAIIKQRTAGDPYPRIRFSKDKAKRFGDWLYDKNYSFVLERKYAQYKLFHEVRGKAHYGINNSQTKGILCIETKQVYITAKECALKELNKTNPGAMNSIRAVCRGERKSTGNKHFRYLTEQEWEDVKNGVQLFNF